MSISINWPTKVISIPKDYMILVQLDPFEVRELDLNQFRLDLKDLEDEIQGINWLKTHNHNPPFAIGGIELARTVNIVNGYTITFEDGQYAVNLVGANSNVGDRVNLNQVSVRPLNSAGLVQSSDIEYSSFNGGATLDPINGNDQWKGNSQYPVKTLSRAKEVLNYRGFKTILLVGSLTLEATDDVTDININGESPNKSYVYVTNGCVTERVHFNNVAVEGTLTGTDADFCGCFISDLSGFVGIARNCLLAGTITLSGSDSDIATFTDCYLGTTAVGLVEIDMGGDGPVLAMRPYTGGVRIKNKSGTAKVAIDFLSGRLELMSSVTAGTFFIRGVGEITVNQATGITLDDDALINPAIAADSVWDEIRAEHNTTGTFGATSEWAGGTGSDWTGSEKEQIRDALGLDGTKSTASGGQLQSVKGKTDNLPSDPASQSTTESAITTAESNIRGTDSDDLKVISDEMDTVSGKVDNVSNDIGTVSDDVGSIATSVAKILKIESGRWKIINNQMIFYDSNGVTPLLRFNLKGQDGQPTSTNVFERVPV